jgi:hypothetical protein
MKDAKYFAVTMAFSSTASIFAVNGTCRANERWENGIQRTAQAAGIISQVGHRR